MEISYCVKIMINENINKFSCYNIKIFFIKKFIVEVFKIWKINKYIFWLWNFVFAYFIVIIVCMIYNIEFVLVL